MEKSADNRDTLMQGILRKEGGYSPHAPNDPETLFGITIRNWADNLPKLSAKQMSALPRSLKSHIDTICATTGQERIRHTESFMRDIGYLLDPTGRQTEQPMQGLPLRSTEHGRPNLTAAQRELLDATQTLAKDILFDKYARIPGFDQYPAKLGDQVIRSSINAGAPRALWATWKSLYEAKAIDDDTYRRLPALTSSEVNNRNIFSRENAGEAYTNPASFRMVAEAVNHASAEQINRAADRFAVWQNVYYKVLATESPDKQVFSRGWHNAVKAAHREATGKTAIDYGQPASHLSSSPASTVKDEATMRQLLLTRLEGQASLELLKNPPLPARFAVQDVTSQSAPPPTATAADPLAELIKSRTR